jgi:hypothetical protein
MLKAIPKEYHDSSKGTLKLLWEDEWRALGITQVSPLPPGTTVPRDGGDDALDKILGRSVY